MGQSKSKPVLQKIGSSVCTPTVLFRVFSSAAYFWNETSDKLKGRGREGGTVQTGRGSAWTYLWKHDFLPSTIGCRQSLLKKPGGRVMATMYSLVLLFFSQDEIIRSTELSSSFLREKICVAQAGLHLTVLRIGPRLCWDSRQVLSCLVPEYKMLKNCHL